MNTCLREKLLLGKGSVSLVCDENDENAAVSFFELNKLYEKHMSLGQLGLADKVSRQMLGALGEKVDDDVPALSPKYRRPSSSGPALLGALAGLLIGLFANHDGVS